MELVFEISLVGNAVQSKGSVYPFDKFNWIDDASNQIIDDAGNELLLYDT